MPSPPLRIIGSPMMGDTAYSRTWQHVTKREKSKRTEEIWGQEYDIGLFHKA